MKSFFLVICVSLGCLAGCSRKGEPEPILIGHVASLSGADKARGEHAKQGIALAVEEANAEANRVLDRRVIVTHADTRSAAAAVRSVVKRLLSIDRVTALLGGPETASLENVAAIAQSANVPFVLSSNPPTGPVAEYVFFTALTPAAQGRVLGRFAAEEWTGAKLGVVTDGKHDALVTAFTQTVPQESLAGAWTYASAEKLPPLAKEVSMKKPAAVLFAGKPADLLEWTRAEPVRLLPVLFAADDLASASVAPVVFQATAYSPGDDTPAAEQFRSKYQERFGVDPAAAGALAYDDARLLFEAIRRAKLVEGPKVAKELAELRFEGLTGPIAFDKQHAVIRTVYIVKLSEGKTQLHKRYPPDEK